MKKSGSHEQRLPSFDVEKSGSSATVPRKGRPSSVRRGATGPRTTLGKQKSKYNAIKYGILSSVVLLESESRSEFETMVRGLARYFHPVGTAEELQVEKLATLHWRYRRLLIAENAEIRQGISFPKDHRSSKAVTIRVVETRNGDHNLMQWIDRPEIREKCLKLLNELRTEIDCGHFDSNRDIAILTKLYGEHTPKSEKRRLFERYRIALATSNSSQTEWQKNQPASPEQCKRQFLEEIEEEIRCLDRAKSIEQEETKLELLRHYVPESPRPDRLQRYEVNIERSIDRALSQLERMQRMRLGQQVLPKLEVQHSLS
jgi:hypothetical protein